MPLHIKNKQEGDKKMSDFISFAEYHIKNTDSDFLEKYWDWERNELNPYKIRHSSGKKYG